MRRWATALLAGLLCACRGEAVPAEAVKPTVYVLTSLPLLFDEGFGLEPATGAAAKFLRARYTLKAIDLPSELPPGATLLAAQPRALPAEELVVLDRWVRDGGRLVLFADPLLDGSSERALGDPLRPPISFADTGLLLHWGLRLDAPDGSRQSTSLTDGEIEFVSIGTLVRVGGACSIEQGGWMASCRLGKGTAVIVADADLLDLSDTSAIGERSVVSRFLETLLTPPKAIAK